jgi:response regulator RpfG family c-di-GMP phosphodiesterase
MNQKILIVDDEQNLLDSLKRQLRKDFQIETALGPEEGLKAIPSQGPFAVIVSDLRMPVMDGIEFLYRAEKIAPESVRVILTGNADLQNAIQAVNKGNIYRFLTKPCSTKILTSVLNQGVEQYRLVTTEKELQEKNKRLVELTGKQNEELKELNKDLEKKVLERTRELDEKNESLKKVNDELQRSVMDSVRLLSSLVGSLSPKLGMHMKNVADFSKKIAEALALEKDQVESIEIAAMIHDIGLIGVSQILWQKDEKEMKSSEFEGYCYHPVIASICLESVKSLEEVQQIVLHHHEHFDGGGYPAGLKGREIPLGSRIIGVAGDYCRVIMNWSENQSTFRQKAGIIIGKKAENFSFSSVQEYMNRIKELFLLSRSGTYYDPEIVDHFLTLQSLCKYKDVGQERNMTPIHYKKLDVGMELAMELYTHDGRFVLRSGSVLNHSLLEGVKRLAEGKAIPESIYVIKKS